jgi:CRISPR-associated endonuclease Csn1
LKHTNITSLKSDFNNEEIKLKDLFSEIEKLLNIYYKENNILDSKGKVKSIKLKESGLTTPKGGDVIDNHKLFPYIKMKVSGFNAKIEGIDYNIDTTGKISEL